MRFQINATLHVADPDALVTAARAHSVAADNHGPAGIGVEEFIPDAAHAVAGALTHVLDFASLAELIEDSPGGCPAYAQMLRSLDGALTIEVSPSAGEPARYTLGAPQ